MASVDLTELARKLLAVEADGNPDGIDAAIRVCIRLRVSLSRLSGTTGFATLMSRALTLARANTPALNGLKVLEDGSLENKAQAQPRASPSAAHDAEAGVALLAQLLGLLVTFIGEPLTLRLLYDAWPELLTTGAKPPTETEP